MTACPFDFTGRTCGIRTCDQRIKKSPNSLHLLIPWAAALTLTRSWPFGRAGRYGAIKMTERKLAGVDLSHDGCAFMNWCISNAKIEPKGNAVAIARQAADFAKIDPLMATFNAVSLMALNPVSENIFSGELMVV